MNPADVQKRHGDLIAGKAGAEVAARPAWKVQRNCVLALVAGLVLIICIGCQTETYSHSEFGERSAHLKSVAVLPPQIKMGTVSNLWMTHFGGTLPEEVKFRTDLPGLLSAGLRKRGFLVIQTTSESFCSDATNQFWNARMQGILNSAYRTVNAARSVKAVRPEAKVLADYVQTDGLIFLNVFAYRSTEGRKATAGFSNFLSVLAAAGGYYSAWTPYRQAIVQIVLVDGKTGDVLWRTIHDFTDFAQTNPEQVVATLLNNYPEP